MNFPHNSIVGVKNRTSSCVEKASELLTHCFGFVNNSDSLVVQFVHCLFVTGWFYQLPALCPPVIFVESYPAGKLSISSGIPS